MVLHLLSRNLSFSDKLEQLKESLKGEAEEETLSSIDLLMDDIGEKDYI
jgi:hypothetical protein